jgi:hypothetical protein
MPVWKKALQEPNAIGWIGLFILVVAIGIGSLFLGGARDPVGPPALVNHAAR